jgi:hypothetical protein
MTKMIKATLIRDITLASLALLMPLAVCGAAPKPQDSQSESVADAARKARNQKTNAPAKTGKVYTNDDLSQIQGGVSVVGTVSDADATKVVKASAVGDKGAAKSGSQDEAYWRAKFADARRVLSDDARELDIEQREFNLKQTQFYSDPNVALREQHDREDLNSTQAKIDTLKAKVDKDKQAISDLEEELRKAGGDPSWAQDTSNLPVPAQPPSNGQAANSSSEAKSGDADLPAPAMPASDTPQPSTVQPSADDQPKN